MSNPPKSTPNPSNVTVPTSPSEEAKELKEIVIVGKQKRKEEENISGLLNPNTIITLSQIKPPKTFGSQEKEQAKQLLLFSVTQSRLAKLLKEKASLIKEKIELEAQHQIYVNVTLFNKKTPKKQIVNGEVKELEPELTEEEYQQALIVENGGEITVVEDGVTTVKQYPGNYTSAKKILDEKIAENQKQIDDFLKDPFKKQKDKIKELKAKLKERKQRTKEEKKKARKARFKTILAAAKAAGKALSPVIMITLSNQIAEIISQNDTINKLVNETNQIIEEANLSQNLSKLQAAKVKRDSTIKIIDDNIKKLDKINKEIQRIFSIINVFSVVISIISSIPIPTSVPPGVGIPVSLIMKFFKILDKATRVVNILGAYIPSIILTLNKAIQILNDYRNKLLNINGEIDKASVNSSIPQSFVTPPQSSTEEFSKYKGFKFALKEEEDPRFVVRGYKRKYAIAINTNGIEVLKSEYSFTLDPNDLIDQLKLIIDQQNLQG